MEIENGKYKMFVVGNSNSMGKFSLTLQYLLVGRNMSISFVGLWLNPLQSMEIETENIKCLWNEIVTADANLH